MDKSKSRDIKLMFLFSWLVWTMANITHPIMPTHFTNLNLPAEIYGITTGLTTLGMVIGAPTLGSISDGGYRIDVMTSMLILYGFMQMALGLVTSVSAILLVRFMAGLSSSAFNLSLMSIISDLSDEDEKIENITIYGALMGVATPFGYLIGGLLGLKFIKAVFYIQTVSSILIAILIFLTIENTNSEMRKNTEIKTIITVVKEAKANDNMFTPWVKVFLVMVLFSGFGYGIVNTVFNFYINMTLGLSPTINGIWRALVGLIGLALNLTFNMWLIEHANLKRTLEIMGVISGLTGILVFISSNFILFFIMNLIFMISYVIQQPIMQSFAVEASHENVGLMTSIYNVLKSMGEMLGSFASGVSYEIFPRLPFLLSGISYILFTLIIIFKGRNTEN